MRKLAHIEKCVSKSILAFYFIVMYKSYLPCHGYLKLTLLSNWHFSQYIKSMVNKEKSTLEEKVLAMAASHIAFAATNGNMSVLERTFLKFNTGRWDFLESSSKNNSQTFECTCGGNVIPTRLIDIILLPFYANQFETSAREKYLESC